MVHPLADHPVYQISIRMHEIIYIGMDVHTRTLVLAGIAPDGKHAIERGIQNFGGGG